MHPALKASLLIVLFASLHVACASRDPRIAETLQNEDQNASKSGHVSKNTGASGQKLEEHEAPAETASPSVSSSPLSDDNNDDGDKERIFALETGLIILICVLAVSLLLLIGVLCCLRRRFSSRSPVEIPLLSQTNQRQRLSASASQRGIANALAASMIYLDEIPARSFLKAQILSQEPIEIPTKTRCLSTFHATVESSLVAGLALSASTVTSDELEKFILAAENLVYLVSKRSAYLIQYLHISPEQIDGEIRLFHEVLPPTLGEIIQKYKKKGAKIPCGSLIMICQGVLEALAALHHQAPPMLHGHVTVNQIYVDMDFETGEVKRVKLNCPGLNNPWNISQTALVLTPESADQRKSGNQNTQTFMCDIFSFGLVLFEIMSLQKPYADMDQAATLKAVAQGRRPTFPPSVTFTEYLNLISVFMDCTEMEPWFRPSAATLLRDPRLRIPKNSPINMRSSLTL